MDPFTHAFIPYLLSKMAGRNERDSRLIGLGGAVPDFDSLSMWIAFLFPQAYVLAHRGVTHTILFALPFSAVFLCFFSMDAVKRFMGKIITLDFDFSARSFILVYAGSLFHLLLDLLTTGGIPLFYPFSEIRYSAHLFFYEDTFLSIFSLLIVILLLSRKLSERKRDMALYLLLFLFLALGTTRIALKSSMDFANSSVYPTFDMAEWVVVQKGKDAFTVFRYNAFAGKSGESHVVPYTNKTKIKELVDKAYTVPEVRRFSFQQSDAEVYAQRGDGEWTLYFFNPVEKPFAEEEPPLYITGDFPDVTVRIYDDGRVELVSG